MGIAGINTKSPKEIIETVLDYFDLTYPQLLKRDKKRDTVYCRHILFYILFKEGKVSKTAITNRYSISDRSTIIHAITSIQNRIDQEPKVKEEVEMIINLL